MSEDLQAIADSARDLYQHLVRETARSGARQDGAVGSRVSAGGLGHVEYGKTAPLADARRLWRAMADAGWLGLLIDEARGGLGLGLPEALAIAEQAGRHPGQPALLVPAVQIANCLGAADTDAAAALLERFLDGSLLAGLAWQEAPGQLDVTLRDSQRSGNAGLLLTGTRLAVSPLADVDGWLVLASGSRGPALVWVARGTEGISLLADQTSDGSDSGRLEFDAVQVDMRNVVAEGDLASRVVAMANDRARLVQAAMLIGLADEVLQQTLEYLRTRVQFGRPLGSFQALQHRCVDAFMGIQVSRACLEDVLHELRDPAALPFQASRAKARTAETGLRVTRVAMHLHGAIGVTDELPISGFFRRALQLSAWLGNAGAHRRRCLRLRPSRDTAAARPPVDYPADVPLDQLEESQFRAAVRDFLAENFPADLRFLPRNAKWSEWKPWFQSLHRKGWSAPAWPKEYGGLGLPQDMLLAMLEEQESFGVPRAPTESSVGMLGPLLLRFGTEAQRQLFLPGILSGETIWCQGYSEPNAGSDLASLRTRAHLEDDHFVVNGQKIWTSIAAEATHMFALVRTRDEGPRQAGISFLLLDMKSPGLTVRPIRDMAGHDKFCEVFFDNVRVPVENLVGPLHGGWTIAKALLGYERVAIGGPSYTRVAIYQLESLGRARGLFEDGAFAQRFAELELDMLDVGAMYRLYSGYIRRGESLPDHVPLVKIWATETLQNITAFTVEAADEHGACLDVLELDGDRVGTAGAHMSALFGFIYGGTNDIQRNILARQVLRLPTA